MRGRIPPNRLTRPRPSITLARRRSRTPTRCAIGDPREGPILDLLVIGGGIHGVAIGRDAALRGLTVLVVERGDLAGATSSRTSKLIHGGIRYLEQAKFSLVREALRERAVLLRIAPGLVRPLTFLLPTYRGEGRPRWKLRAGLSLYALLARGDALASHRAHSAAEARRLEPGLRAEGLTGAFEYHDAQMDDALLAVATSLAAERAGAEVRTYAETRALERSASGWRARVVDRLSGLEEAIEARMVVNAAGPWADAVRGMAGFAGRATVRRTRGTHVVLEGALVSHALLLTARRDGRAFFAIPWGSHTLLGTTDVDDDRDPDVVRPTPGDVRYLLEEAARALPAVPKAGKPVRAFAGVRPLAATARGGAPSESSREHRVVIEAGMVTVVGGKYTTHRSLAARVVDRVIALDGRRAPASSTADSLLTVARGEGIEALRTAHPARVALQGGLSIDEAEVVYAVRHEKAKTLEDVLLRRTRLWLDGRAARDAAEPASRWMALLRKWDENARRAAVADLRAALDAEAKVIEEGS